MEIQTLENINIAGNQNKPSVKFNAETGELLLEGRSILENTIRFFDPLVDWLNDYIQNPAELTAFHIKLEYFNTSTSKYLLSMVDKLAEFYAGGKEVLIYWYYGDEDMLELGEDYQNMLDVPFKMIEHKFL